MADKTKIEWTDATWTPIRARYWESQNDGSGKERVGWHCEHASEGCRNCYSERLNLRLGTGLPFKPDQLMRPEKIGYNNGESNLFLDDSMLSAPLRWARPRMIFVCSMTDLFADFVPDWMIDRMFVVMALTRRHTYQVLTKRPERMARYVADFSWARAIESCKGDFGSSVLTKHSTYDLQGAVGLRPRFTYEPDCSAWPASNIWLGFSAEDQKNFNERHEALRPLADAGWLTWCSAEPLLGGIRLPSDTHIKWLVDGGESGSNARPSHPDWFRALRDDCGAGGIPYLHKQNGEWHTGCSSMLTGEARFRQFRNFNEWVNKASTWVSGGICLDRFGRQLRNGGDMMKAHDEDRFPVTVMHKVGKKAAGRTLDGVTHDGYPQVSA